MPTPRKSTALFVKAAIALVEEGHHREARATMLQVHARWKFIDRERHGVVLWRKAQTAELAALWLWHGIPEQEKALHFLRQALQACRYVEAALALMEP